MTAWLRPDEAAAFLRTSEGNVRVVAHRLAWHRRRVGRGVRYRFEDVDAEVKRRAALQSARAVKHWGP